MHKHTLLLAGLTALLAAGAAQATTLTQPMNVSAVVTAACSDLQIGDMDFGSADQVDANDNQTANILVTCAQGSVYTVEIDYGVNAIDSQRRVGGADPAEYMDYTIFQPDAAGAAATTLPWGTLADGDAYAGTGTGTQQTLVATGRLSRTETTTPGTYTDLVIVSLNF